MPSISDSKFPSLAILGLCALAYGQPNPSAWLWALAVAIGFAAFVLFRSFHARREILSQPFSIGYTSLVLSRFLLPAAVVLSGLPALVLNSPGLLDAALIFAITLAIAHLL